MNWPMPETGSLRYPLILPEPRTVLRHHPEVAATRPGDLANIDAAPRIEPDTVRDEKVCGRAGITATGPSSQQVVLFAEDADTTVARGLVPTLNRSILKTPSTDSHLRPIPASRPSKSAQHLVHTSLVVDIAKARALSRKRESSLGVSNYFNQNQSYRPSPRCITGRTRAEGCFGPR